MKTLALLYLVGVIFMFAWLTVDASKNPGRRDFDRMPVSGYLIWGLINFLWPLIAVIFVVVLLLEVLFV